MRALGRAWIWRLVVGLVLVGCAAGCMTHPEPHLTRIGPVETPSPGVGEEAQARPFADVSPGAFSEMRARDGVSSPANAAGDVFAFAAMRPRHELLIEGHVPREGLAALDMPRFEMGDRDVFWVGDMGIAGSEITATLVIQSDHLQMWVDERVALDANMRRNLERSAHTFDERIYESNRTHFGSEWRPGIDGDPRLVVLNAIISGAAGYFTASNEYPRHILPRSNEREMFVMNIGSLTPGYDGYDSVLAHEFQHMIHWYQDSNEAAWLNEGMSELAEDLAGYGWSSGSVADYGRAPDVQLNAWTDVPSDVSAHYGASYLMVRYLWERFGSDMIRELVAEPADGIAGVDVVLRRTGHAEGFDAVFADWLVANVLDDPVLDDGRYGYAGVDVDVVPEPVLVGEAGQDRLDGETRHVVSLQDRSVSSYGADYYEVTSRRPTMLQVSFDGDPEVAIVPNEPAGGRWQWWSNRGDSGYASLIGRFDLTSATSATLAYDAWYDIEPGWDYAYLRASRDEGAVWEIVPLPRATSYDPNGNALGLGYTGRSGADPLDARATPAWIHEVVDLSAYAGDEVWLRFDYVTDDAVHYAGLCLDNIELAALGLRDDAEAPGGMWESRGFVRLTNRVAQRYLVQVIAIGDEGPQVERIEVDTSGHGEAVIEGLGDAVSRVIVIVSATTPGTRERAGYSLEMALIDR